MIRIFFSTFQQKWHPFILVWKTIKFNRKYSQTEYGLHRNVERRHIKRFKEYFCSLLPVSTRVQGGLRQQHRMFLWKGLQLVVAVDVVPYSFHIIPVSDNTMFHRVADAKQPSVLFRLWPHEQITFQGTGHHPHMLRSSNTIINQSDLVSID